MPNTCLSGPHSSWCGKTVIVPVLQVRPSHVRDAHGRKAGVQQNEATAH